MDGTALRHLDRDGLGIVEVGRMEKSAARSQRYLYAEQVEIEDCRAVVADSDDRDQARHEQAAQVDGLGSAQYDVHSAAGTPKRSFEVAPNAVEPSDPTAAADETTRSIEALEGQNHDLRAAGVDAAASVTSLGSSYQGIERQHPSGQSSETLRLAESSKREREPGCRGSLEAPWDEVDTHELLHRRMCAASDHTWLVVLRQSTARLVGSLGCELVWDLHDSPPPQSHSSGTQTVDLES